MLSIRPLGTILGSTESQIVLEFPLPCLTKCLWSFRTGSNDWFYDSLFTFLLKDEMGYLASLQKLPSHFSVHFGFLLFASDGIGAFDYAQLLLNHIEALAALSDKESLLDGVMAYVSALVDPILISSEYSEKEYLNNGLMAFKMVKRKVIPRASSTELAKWIDFSMEKHWDYIARSMIKRQALCLLEEHLFDEGLELMARAIDKGFVDVEKVFITKMEEIASRELQNYAQKESYSFENLSRFCLVSSFS